MTTKSGYYVPEEHSDMAAGAAGCADVHQERSNLCTVNGPSLAAKDRHACSWTDSKCTSFSQCISASPGVPAYGRSLPGPPGSGWLRMLAILDGQ
jgi:hypothetical protein